MSTKTFDIAVNLPRESLAANISAKWKTWLDARANWESQYRKVLEYLYSTTTDTITGQRSNPWSANVHIPKLTQLRDTMITYALDSLFSLKDYYTFEGFTRSANTVANRELVLNLLKNIIEDSTFKRETERLLQDYIDSGNAFATAVWNVETVEDPSGFKKILREGPVMKRINPLDIVFDPTAADFNSSPKIIRTVVSIGELAALADKDPVMKKAFNKALGIRKNVMTSMTNGDTIKDEQINIAGFGSWRTYFNSEIVELLTFYGTIYEVKDKKLHENVKITIMDRNIVLKEEPLVSYDGYETIFKTGYRDRKDILWSMSPLDNILGMQARIDFLENKRSDCYDAVVNPVKVITGNVDMPDSLGPGDEIRKDVDADVKYLAPDTTILTADNLMDKYEYKMEEMVGSPKEMLGFRSPGEKTMFEVDQLMTAAVRQSNRQSRKFEEEVLEPILNLVLKMYLKKMAGQKVSIKVWDPENELYIFKDISIDAIESLGKIKVVGSTTYQEKQQMAQALQMLGQNPLFMDEVVRNNFSPAMLGQIFNYVSGLDKFPDLYKKDSRLFEITEQQKLVEKLSQQIDEEKAQGMADLSENANKYALQQEIAQERILGVPNEQQQ